MVWSSADPLGVMLTADRVTTFGATSPAGAMASCGLTFAPVPVSAKSCDPPLAAIVRVPVRVPIAAGLNCAVTLQVDDGASEPPSRHVVVNGNSAALESITLVSGTAAVPVFHKVMTTGVADVRPTPVVANVDVGHVMTNVAGVMADGAVDEVLLEQPAASAVKSTR